MLIKLYYTSVNWDDKIKATFDASCKCIERIQILSFQSQLLIQNQSQPLGWQAFTELQMPQISFLLD